MTKQTFHEHDRGLTIPRRVNTGSNGNGIGSDRVKIYPPDCPPGPRPLADRHRDALARIEEREERIAEYNRRPKTQRFDTVKDLLAWVAKQEEQGKMHLETFQEEQADKIALVGDTGLLKRCYIDHNQGNDDNPCWKAITETSTGEIVTLTLWNEDIEPLVWPERLANHEAHRWSISTDLYHPDDSPPNLNIEFIYVMNSKRQLRANPLPEGMREAT